LSLSSWARLQTQMFEAMPLSNGSAYAGDCPQRSILLLRSGEENLQNAEAWDSPSKPIPTEGLFSTLLLNKPHQG